MKVNNYTNTNIKPMSPSFRANYFFVHKEYKRMQLMQIATDNEENLGNEPVLELKETDGSIYTYPMTYNGKYYVSEKEKSMNELSSYRIFYKDTGKYERGGEAQVINPMAFVKTANQFDMEYNKLPSERAIGKGEAKGKVFVNTFDIPEDVPVILILDEIDAEKTVRKKIPDNVCGLITAACSYGDLEHKTNRFRNDFSMVSVVLDKDKFNRLKELEGKNVSVNNESGFVEYNEINPVFVEEVTEEPEKVEVPKLERVERLLDFDELTPQNCGNKGYRLGVMQRLAEEGKLKDITIPNGFVIPEGYINQLKEIFDMENSGEKWNLMYDSIYAQEIKDKAESLKLGGDLILRSNFNTEDRRSFSSAGIYESENYVLPDDLLYYANNVIKSKDSDIARETHDKYGIEDSQIQPSVIVQKQIKGLDVDFTVYSDDGEGNILFDLNNDYKNNRSSVAFVKYNKKTKEFNVVKNENKYAEYIFNEEGEIIEHQHNTDYDIDVDKITPMLKTIAEGAMVLEDYFDYPQDIEGGIKDGKVYFWQTRDIVAKGKKKI